MENKAFTLIELLVVIAIVGVLSSIILFSVTQYINKGKDASTVGNLVVLVTTGEVYYDHNSTTPNSYEGFCDTATVVNSLAAISSPKKYCKVRADNNAWVACAQLTDVTKAYCVDSRGVKKEIDNSYCSQNITVCP